MGTTHKLQMLLLVTLAATFCILQLNLTLTPTHNKTPTSKTLPQTISNLKSTFTNLYNLPAKSTDIILSSSLYKPPTPTSNPNSPSESIAKRFALATSRSTPFHVAFGGYSVAAGRGNYFHQAYSQVFAELFEPVLKEAGIELKVTNTATGGIPSFPYAWCMDTFYGLEPDVITWDVSSYNEAHN